MRNLIPILLALFAFCASTDYVSAQSNDEQLAAHYYQEGDYEKASMYYNRLYDQSGSVQHYQYLLRCMIELKQWKDGEKLVKRQMRRDPRNLIYYVDLGTLHTAAEDPGAAKEQYERAIKEITANQAQITTLADAFIEKKELDFAVACYRKGLKLLNNDYYFNFQIATVQGMQGDHESMISTYLDLVGENDRYLETVQTALNRSLNFQEDDARAELLRTQLLRRVQKQPNKLIFSNMLIWLFIQKKDFNAAYVQTKALDKRENGHGKRVRELGALCASNHEYGVAVKCYEYVVELGEYGHYYQASKIELLDVMNQKITNSNYTQEDLLQLETKYLEAIDELGKSAGTADLMKQVAHLQAFYLKKEDDAIGMLREVLALPGLNNIAVAQSKLELGDVLLLNGDIWDASLYYMQVDRAFKHDVMGHEAKFRNARISFFTGDFEWAQTQLDVLKASTSKLIANDAMNLSLLITDNLNLDTTPRAMNLYAQADLLVFQNRFDEALEYMDTITSEYPGHSLTDEIMFQKYKIERRRQNWEKASEYLQRIVTFHGDDILGDDATFRLAQLYDFVIKDEAKAEEFYKKLLLDYPGSLYVVEARKRYRALQGETFNDGTIIEIE